ncbi:hypothetical protein Tco_1019811 [Tanacetum coccineum]|uniref:Retrotransposon gag domain-containing protein n=1 Tax=Tanacetum coccineum TaxID=301880 RepID=A0ABQ5FYA6_9ASTR
MHSNYKEFRAVMHENFRGTEGAVGLTRWFEKLESQFGISNVAEGDRVKFASSTLLDGALTWWNVYVRSVTLDTAHATPWSDFSMLCHPKSRFLAPFTNSSDVSYLECPELWPHSNGNSNLAVTPSAFVNPPTPSLILYGDLTTMMETTKECDDKLWRNQTEWEIISWRFYESTGVHVLELENGTMIHMLVEQRYPLTRELMQRMLEHKLKVQKEIEDALNVIKFVMKQKEDLEREEE